MNRLLAFGLSLVSSGAIAQGNSVIFASSVPTLDEMGIAGLIVLVGAVGGWLARRRK